MASNEGLCLYKYRSIAPGPDVDRVSKIFANNEVYFSTIGSFNDPFEGKFKVSFDACAEHKMAIAANRVMQENPGLTEEEALQQATRRYKEVEKHGEKNLKAASQKVGVFSLTERNDDILMWSHYADSHRGICIEFKASKMHHVDMMRKAHRVTYQNALPSINFYLDTLVDKLKAYIHTKAAHWSYEQEWRIVDTDGPGLKTLPDGLISSVILGHAISKENKRRVLKWISDYPHVVSLYEARLNKDAYALDIVPVG